MDHPPMRYCPPGMENMTDAQSGQQSGGQPPPPSNDTDVEAYTVQDLEASAVIAKLFKHFPALY